MKEKIKEGGMSREDLIEQVEKGTGYGMRIAKRELAYVRRLWCEK